MIPNPDDTIVALASARGPGQRGIVRLSGPSVRDIVASIFSEFPRPWPSARRMFRGQIRMPELLSPLPADLYFSPGPRSYTGQDTAELHCISCPPLLDAVLAALMNAGARAARAGEFTLRAFLAGKKDLMQAEAVNAVIEAGSPDELNEAIGQLAGGITQPLQSLRDDLLSLLADIEAGLDFTEEDIEFVAKKEILQRFAKGLALLTNLRRQLEMRAVSDKRFRVVLTGEPNAGKSSLFNALAGLSAAIVGPIPGTTRDYLTRSVGLNDLSIELVDTAGWQQAKDLIEQQAQALGSSQAKSADLLLWCVDSTQPLPRPRIDFASVPVILVATKTDLRGNGGSEFLSTCGVFDAVAISTKTGAGVAQLKQTLADRVRALLRPALAPSLSRCQHHVDAALKNLRVAHGAVLFDSPMELVALDLRLALEQIGEMAGAVYTDDLLDRIFSRFCIGK